MTSNLILNEPGGLGSGYIVLGEQHEPLDQTDLSNGLDASSKAVGEPT